jgi:hypothetical protein
MFGSVRYRDAETIVPATCRVVTSKVQRGTSAKLARRNDHRRYELTMYQTVAFKIFRELFDYTLYINSIQQYCVSRSEIRCLLGTEHDESRDWEDMHISIF